jgi:hypothetical protein
MPWVMSGALVAMWINQRLETTGSSVGLFVFRLGIVLVVIWTTWTAICFLYLTQ